MFRCKHSLDRISATNTEHRQLTAAPTRDSCSVTFPNAAAACWNSWAAAQIKTSCAIVGRLFHVADKH